MPVSATILNRSNAIGTNETSSTCQLQLVFWLKLHWKKEVSAVALMRRLVPLSR